LLRLPQNPYFGLMQLRSKIFWGILPLLMMLGGTARAQLFVGYNIGPALGRTLDADFRYYPKNEDWISFSLGGGYTFNGKMYFPRKKAECLSDFRNGGWHMRFGARNSFTTDHHDNHLFWGLDFLYSRQNESATFNTCDSTLVPERISQSVNVLSGSINFGYTWNPRLGKSIYQKFLLDFGLRVGYPIWSTAPLLGERDYISGLGFRWFPIRSLTLEPIVAFRWELFHGKYGYSKGKTKTRYKQKY
jgi:hypothetical protein